MRREVVYFFAGIVLAAAMMPAAVVAASFVKIQGFGGTVAQVDGARQLLVSESDPAAFFYKLSGVDSSDGCVLIDSRPSTSGLIVKQLRLHVFSGAGPSKSLILYANK